MIMLESYGECTCNEELSPVGATGFTASKIRHASGVYSGRDAKVAIIVAETNSIRFMMDGGTPTANAGFPVAAGGTYTIVGVQNIKRFKCIDSSGPSTVQVQYFYGI